MTKGILWGLGIEIVAVGVVYAVAKLLEVIL
jgi:hypothetical protein